MKPHKGNIEGWKKYFHPDYVGFGLEYIILGRCIDHPNFGTSSTFHTSYVVSYNEATGEIETRNSRYTLVGPERK